MITRNLDKAKDAYNSKDVKASIDSHNAKYHSKDARIEKHEDFGSYIKSAVYGGLDGTITTFAVVAGVAGANLNAGVVLILGFANLIGDGISMAVGDYLSTKSQKEYHKKERAREEWEIANNLEGEKQEMIEIYTQKGMSSKDAKKIVDTMAKNKNAFVDVMMVEELGILESYENPLKNALVTFFSFAFFGMIPLLAYVAALFINLSSDMFLIATLMTGITMFVLGSLRSHFTGKNWFTSGIEMLIVGGIAATAAYLIGYALAGLA